MNNYQKRYYHDYKNKKKRANLVLELEDYQRFEDYAQAQEISVNQAIRALALAQLDGLVPLSPEWSRWQSAIQQDLHRVGNEIHQLNLLLGELGAPPPKEILQQLFQHLQALQQKWLALDPRDDH